MNFDLANLSDYEITWTIDPLLQNMNKTAILRQGAMFQVMKGAWSPNTNYKVAAKVFYRSLPQHALSKLVAF